MSDPTRNIQSILMDRLKITQAIAAANVEHLRLNQKASGMLVLDMKDEEDNVVDEARLSERQEIFDALDVNMDKINDLEAALKAIDKELNAVVKEREG